MSSGYHLTTVVEDLLSPDRWECEDISYVPEHLTLPTPTGGEERRPGAESSELRRAYADDCRRLLLMSETRVTPLGESLGPDGPSNALFWFRWIAGHQVSFIIWRLLAGAAEEAGGGLESSGNALRAMTHYLRGYSAMLLYTSSCPCEVYETFIRPSMFRQHPGFSGGWAPDYGPVRELLRGRIPAWAEKMGAAELRRAVRLSHVIHEEVAAKLVPNGRSLLQQSGLACRGVAEEIRQLGEVYDDYFLTLRAPVAHEAVVTQLMGRLNVVARDVAVNGLSSHGAVSRGKKSDDLHASLVAPFEAEFFKTCFRVAGCAAGFTDDEMIEQQERLARV